jgi:hypothetical protein
MERELSRDDCLGLMPEWKDLNPQTESLSGGITNKLGVDLTVEKLIQQISDHQQSWGYEDGPWKGPGPPLLVAADLSQFINRRHRSGLHPSSMPSR